MMASLLELEKAGTSSHMVTISEEKSNPQSRESERNPLESRLDEDDEDGGPCLAIQISEPLDGNEDSTDAIEQEMSLPRIIPSTPPPSQNPEILDDVVSSESLYAFKNEDTYVHPSHDYDKYDDDERFYSRNTSPEYPMYNRGSLLEQYREAIETRNALQSANIQAQHKLAEYFRKKKTDERAPETEKNVTDQDQRYLKYISNLEEIQGQYVRQKDQMQTQLGELKDKCTEKQSRVTKASEEFLGYKYEVGSSAVNSRSGKPIPRKDLEQYKSNELKKEKDVIQVRYENIKLKNRLKKREQQLKAKEELAEGLHLIDFEQLKIENQTYNEKIEERNEELLKLRKKITTTVQISTHLKEKLQFVQAESGDLRLTLKECDKAVAEARDVSTKIKQERDKLRTDNARLKQKCGLLGSETLLSDFEEQREQMSKLQQNIQVLKDSHIDLSLNVNGLRKKIEHSKMQDNESVK